MQDLHFILRNENIEYQSIFPNVGKMVIPLVFPQMIVQAASMTSTFIIRPIAFLIIIAVVSHLFYLHGQHLIMRQHAKRQFQVDSHYPTTNLHVNLYCNPISNLSFETFAMSNYWLLLIQSDRWSTTLMYDFHLIIGMKTLNIEAFFLMQEKRLVLLCSPK